MTASNPQGKAEKMKELTRSTLEKGSTSATTMLSLLGTLKSTRLINNQAALHYSGLQYQNSRRSHDDKIIRKASMKDLKWWTHSFNTSISLREGQSTLQMWKDALGLVGWGDHTSRGRQEQGRWE